MNIQIDESFLSIFPNAKIGVIISNNVNNTYSNIDDYTQILSKAQEKAKEHITNSEFSKNEVISRWREAYKKFKTKKGVRSSIEALLKRVENGKGISTISPLVDIYNSISLEFAVPCGGEDIEHIVGDMRLTVAYGGETFITLGSEESDPALEGEIVYKDDEGIICRCWNWRESVRTMLTEKTTNAVFIIESIDGKDNENFYNALNSLENRLQKYVGGKHTMCVLDRENNSFSM